MTIGEKIQTHRKLLGLSQDELGQKLLVSRQTISLWEKDQTYPSIDNLLRLREIFNISVDELLGIASEVNYNKKLPNEYYKFSYNKEELDKFFKNDLINRFLKQFIITIILLFIGIYFLTVPDMSPVSFTFILLFAVNIVSLIKGISVLRKIHVNSLFRVLSSVYEYMIFDDFIKIIVYRNNEIAHETKCYFSDIEKIQQFDNFIVFQHNGLLYIMRQNELKENSIFFSYMYNNPAITTESPVPVKLRIISLVLFVASPLTIIAAMILILFVSVDNSLSMENLWIFFCLTPVPVASAIFGIIMNKKGYKFKKNIIMGIIITAVLCIYGSFSFVFNDFVDHSDEMIVRTESILKIDIPEHKQIVTQDWRSVMQTTNRGTILITSDVFFEDSAVEVFEKELSENNKWLKTISNNMLGITSSYAQSMAFDYTLIYNIDTEEYNTLPSDSGMYSFINLLYNSDLNQMKIVEYELDYVN